MHHLSHAIASLATALHPSAIGVIRMSGVACHKLLLPLLRFGTNATRHTNPPALRTMHRCTLWRPGAEPNTQEIIDDGLCVFFKGPASYTGEDTAELYLHGGVYVLQESLEALLQAGFHQAYPGEFTQRAYLHGKLDLTMAEGIKELTRAETKHEWQVARALTQGSLSAYVQELRATLLKIRAWLEAMMDFPEEADLERIKREELLAMATTIQTKLTHLKHTFRAGEMMRTGYRIVLAGKPNAGKSTLFNALCGEDRAIITDEAGTTRDYLHTSMIWNDHKIHLFDTAGLRLPTAELPQAEAMGIGKTMELLHTADLILLLTHPSDPATVQLEPYGTAYQWQGTSAQIWPLISHKDSLPAPAWKAPSQLFVSAHHPGDISQLKDKILTLMEEKTATLEGGAFLATPRHYLATTEALRHMERFFLIAKEDGYGEILASEIRQATDALSAIIGEVQSDDILDVVFGDFCLGK